MLSWLAANAGWLLVFIAAKMILTVHLPLLSPHVASVISTSSCCCRFQWLLSACNSYNFLAAGLAIVAGQLAIADGQLIIACHLHHGYHHSSPLSVTIDMIGCHPCHYCRVFYCYDCCCCHFLLPWLSSSSSLSLSAIVIVGHWHCRPLSLSAIVIVGRCHCHCQPLSLSLPAIVIVIAGRCCCHCRPLLLSLPAIVIVIATVLHSHLHVPIVVVVVVVLLSSLSSFYFLIVAWFVYVQGGTKRC